MSLSQLCGPEFSPTTKERGEEYLQEGRVTQLELDSDVVVATVIGNAQSYEVGLNFTLREQGALFATCDCAYYTKGDFCKHIWAVLRQMDSQFKVNMLRGRRIHLVHEENVDVDTGELFDVEMLAAARTSYELMDEGNGKARRPGSNWKRALNQVSSDEYFQDASRGNERTARARKTEARVLQYVLNVGATHTSGRLTIDLFYRSPLKRGGYSKAKKLSLNRDEIGSLPDEDDRWLLSLFFGNDVVDGRYEGYGFSNGLYSYGSYNRCHVLPSMYDLLLPRLAATGRFVWLLDSSMPVEDGKVIHWEPGEPWKCQLHMLADDANRCWNVTARFVRGSDTRSLQDAVLVVQSRLILFQDALAGCEIQSEAAWMKHLLRFGPIVVPYDDRDEWLDKLLELPEIPVLDHPENLNIHQVVAPPQPRLEIKSASKRAYGMNNELLGDLQFIYGEHRITAVDEKAGFYDSKANVMHVRDRAMEAVFHKRLFELGCRESPYYTAPENQYVVVPDRILPALVRILTAENWVIETKGIRMRSAGEFKLDVKSSVDWFELTGKVDFGGVSVGLPTLLTALRKNEVFVRLDDGSQGILPEEWLKKYGQLAQLAEAKGDALRFTASQGLLLDALLIEQENVQVDQGFVDFRNRLKDFGGVRPDEPPQTFQGTLRAYQKEGLGWLNFLREFKFGGCLADDMGLGKTVQVLALLEGRRTRPIEDEKARRPSLVVVPKSLVFNWMDEAKRFAPDMRLLNFTGIERGESHVDTSGYDVLVTTYGTLRRDIVKLKAIRFDYAILDESQAIKNSDSQAAKACRLIQADHRLAMTGTPVENHLGELWSLFEFLNPAMLGRASAFSAFAKSSREYDTDRLRLLSRALRPFLLRRTKEQVLSELPEKTEQTLYCELSPKERKAYNELRDFYRTQLTAKVKEKGFAQSKIHVLEALLRLRQAACHPGLLNEDRSVELSAKLETLFEQIQEVIEGGHKALVFSQFTSLLAIVRKHLDERGIVYEYLDGQTQNRAAPVKRFQEDAACPLFLISLKAGGHGLNLTAADYVFILDPWWNPAVESQAVDRAHRIGQTRRVFAYRLIAKNTVEDKIVELQRSKRELADAIVSADNSVIRNLSREDLELLLS